MASGNQAAVIPKERAHVELVSVPVYEPGPHELLVKNTSLAFNPMEWKHQTLDIFKATTTYPALIGWSYAGTVEQVGPNSAGFSVGDRVVVKVWFPSRGNQYSAFQKYALADVTTVAKLPGSVSLDAASAAILNLMTAVGALIVCMGLERPPISGTAKPKNKKLLIYGGSTVLGSLAVEMARHAGYSVVTTSSPQNMAEVRRFAGTNTPIVNHKQPQQVLINELAVHGPYDYLFDTVTTPPTKQIMAGVLLKQGGGAYWSALPPFPEPDLPTGVERKGASYSENVYADENLRKWFFEEFVPDGLRGGAISVPKIERLPGGLNSVQNALDRMRENKTGGAKLIVDPWDTD